MPNYNIRGYVSTTACRIYRALERYSRSRDNSDGEMVELIMGDIVNHPDHYVQVPEIECIEVAGHFNFCLGNAIKYIWRADHKGDPEEDLRKAIWYLHREIEMRIKRENNIKRFKTPTVLEK